MKCSKFSYELIAFALRQAESGTAVADVWKKKYAHLGVSELRRLRQVEEENRRLNQLVADLTLDKHMATDALRKWSEADAPPGAGHVVSRHVSG
jgi:putative transposase